MYTYVIKIFERDLYLICIHTFCLCLLTGIITQKSLLAEKIDNFNGKYTKQWYIKYVLNMYIYYVHMKHNAAYQHERERYNSRREIKS